MSMKKQIVSILKKALEDVCLEALGELPSAELFPGMPMSKIRLSVRSVSGKDRAKVKKKWDKYLSTISTKRRMVRLEQFEKFRIIEGKLYPKRLDIPGFITVGDPFVQNYAVLDIPEDVALKIIVLGFAPPPN